MKIAPLVIGTIMVVAVLAATYLICGQYYYTDIPGWEKYFSVKGIADNCPRWVYYVLFGLWGYAMYRFWRWIDSRP